MRKSYYGMQYGRLTIIDTRELLTKDKALCKCECGVEKYIQVGSILYHQTQSCGCLNGEIVSKRSVNDLTGQRFGKLIVINRSGTSKYKKALWLCKCDCNNMVVVLGCSLVSGNTTSCGCIKSKSETNCEFVLSKYKIGFETQKMFEDCVYRSKLRFDFYIPSLNICIELDGEQHFKPVKHFGGEKVLKKTQKRDAVKNKYCLDNNIKLLRIPYTEFDNIEQILIDNKIIK